MRRNERRLQEAFFRALADETRLQIIDAIRDRGSLNVTEICRVVRKRAPLVSHHLACLRACHLVSRRRNGKYVAYALNGRSRIRRLLALASQHVEEAGADIASCNIVGASVAGSKFRGRRTRS
ncbi:MAG: ArsR/SmtB family transcription factor [Methanobacteriota archaeon]